MRRFWDIVSGRERRVWEGLSAATVEFTQRVDGLEASMVWRMNSCATGCVARHT